MKPDLHQQNGRDYRKFRIGADALYVERRQLGGYNSYKLDWDEIGFDAVVSGHGFDVRRTFLVGSLLLNYALAVLVVGLVWDWLLGAWWFWALAVAGLLPFVYPLYRLTRTSLTKTLYGDNNVVFFYREQDAAAVDAFIERMRVAHRRYLQRRFLQLDDLLPLDDQVKMVQSLYLSKLISREDLADVMAEVKTRRLFED